VWVGAIVVSSDSAVLNYRARGVDRELMSPMNETLAPRQKFVTDATGALERSTVTLLVALALLLYGLVLPAEVVTANHGLPIWRPAHTPGNGETK